MRLVLALSLILAACGPEPDTPHHQDMLTQNSPHEVVADRVARQPVSYPWRFVVMADAHTPGAEPIFARLRAQMRALDPPPVFVIVAGDAVQDGTLQQHKDYLASINAMPIPFFTVMGNHELVVADGRKNYREIYGSENFSFDYAGCRFIGLMDIVPRHDGLDDAQIMWLEQRLADPAIRDRFVFMHATPPALPPPWGAPPYKNADRLHELIETYGVRFVATGHIHEYRHAVINGVDFFVTGGGGGAHDPLLQDPTTHAIFFHFLLVTVEANGQSKVEVIPEGDLPRVDPNYTIPIQTTPAP
jgi:3',5'-cyclic-AMP phosphodiesterase